MTPDSVDAVPVVLGVWAFLWLSTTLIARLTTRVTSLGDAWYEVRVLGRATRYKYLGLQPRYVETGERSATGFDAVYAVKACPVFVREDGVGFVCGPTARGWLLDLSNEVDHAAWREQIGAPPAPKETP